MKGTLIALVTGALDTVTKGLVRELDDLEIRGRMETLQTAPLTSVRILRKILEN